MGTIANSQRTLAGYPWCKPWEANGVAIRSRDRVRHSDHRRRLALEVEEAEL